MLFFSRSFRRRYTRPFLLCLLILLTLDTLHISTSRPQETRHKYTPAPAQKVFIASIFRNNEYMLRLYWSTALLSLIQTLGPQNVFVSIIESGSQEDTKGVLRDLLTALQELGVAHNIQLGETVDEQAESLLRVPQEGQREGWIFTGRKKIPGGWECRRIPYLARLRNKAMEPLQLLREKEGKVFEKVLWINDVIFTTEDVLTLLSTNSGSYAAACSLDFSHALYYYDTFALRDSSGHKTSSNAFPYFSSSESLTSLCKTPSAIPVQSCWNGMVALDAGPFYAQLQFRGVADSLAREHVEGSECCLIHADNPLSSTHGVFLNADVRVAYNELAYVAVNPGAVFEDVPGGGFARRVKWPGGRRRWPGFWQAVVGSWGNRLRRWTGAVRAWSERSVVSRRVRRWVQDGLGEMRVEPGQMCLVNEMQVLFENGWQHV